MTLIESIVLALIHGLSSFLPIGAEAHDRIIEALLKWPAADALWRSTFSVGILFALLVFFIHDWASIFSSFLQVVLSRKKPMTFDERFPFFLIFSTALPAASYWYIKEQLAVDPERLFRSQSNLVLAGGMVGGALLLTLGERWSKRSRGIFDLQLLDSMLFGAFYCMGAFPGINGALGMMSLALFRNYHFEAATKLIPLFSLPIIAFEAGKSLSVIEWGAPSPFEGVSWTHWAIAVLVSGGAAYLALRVLTEQIRKNGFGRWIAYRVLIGVALVGLHFL